MNRIFKYPLNIGKTSLELPVGSKILSVQMQEHTLTMWALVENTNTLYKTYTFNVYGTGQHVESTEFQEFVATVQDGDLVWHVFKQVG